MIVRSRITPASAGDEERRGNRHQDRRPDVVRHRELHDVGRVGAQHHQLAVRHVDDAHDAERDRQPDGDQHEHRSRGSGRRTASRCPNRTRATIDAAHGVGGGPPDLLVALDEAAVRGFFEHAGQPVAHLRPERCRPASRSRRGGPADRCCRARRAPARSRSLPSRPGRFRRRPAARAAAQCSPRRASAASP